MYRHLVAVEVRVVCHAHQRMELNRLALDQDWFEGLNPQPMKRRRTIEQHRMLADDVVQDVPDVFALLLDQLLGAFNRGDVAFFFKLAVDEWLEQFERHLLRQTALMEPQFGANDDYRTARIIDPLTQQVLPETAR